MVDAPSLPAFSTEGPCGALIRFNSVPIPWAGLGPELLLRLERGRDEGLGFQLQRELREDRLVTRAATKLSEGAFRQVWDNPDDAEYDRLDR